MQAQPELVDQYVALALDVIRLCIWLVLLLAFFALIERLWPLHRRKIFRNAFAIDLVYYFLSGFIPKLLLALPMSLLAAWAHRFAGSGFYAWVAAMPLGARLAGAMVISEIGTYWGHRWSHEIPLLWRFHAIHHSPEEIDWLVSTHAHPVDLAFTRLCGLIPMYLLGFAQPFGNRLDPVPAVVILAGTFWGFFIHANVTWRFGWLEWLISSPGFHHWHHANDGPEYLDKNFAAMLPWVDRIFGTLYLPRKWPAKYGTDTPIPPDLSSQLVQPLLPAKQGA